MLELGFGFDFGLWFELGFRLRVRFRVMVMVRVLVNQHTIALSNRAASSFHSRVYRVPKLF